MTESALRDTLYHQDNFHTGNELIYVTLHKWYLASEEDDFVYVVRWGSPGDDGEKIINENEDWQVIREAIRIFDTLVT